MYKFDYLMNYLGQKKKYIITYVTSFDQYHLEPLIKGRLDELYPLPSDIIQGRFRIEGDADDLFGSNYNMYKMVVVSIVPPPGAICLHTLVKFLVIRRMSDNISIIMRFPDFIRDAVVAGDHKFYQRCFQIMRIHKYLTGSDVLTWNTVRLLIINLGLPTITKYFAARCNMMLNKWNECGRISSLYNFEKLFLCFATYATKHPFAMNRPPLVIFLLSK